VRAVVVGGGAIGCAATALLAAQGVDTVLLTRSAERRQELRMAQRIELQGDVTARGGPVRVEGTFEATAGADVIFVCVQSAGHEAVAASLAPHLQSGQAVLIFSGLAGSLLFARAWRHRPDILLGETATPPCSARLVGPGVVQVRMRTRLRAAAFPACRTVELLARVPAGIPLHPAIHVLDVALHHPNLIVHPLPMLLNYAAIERTDGALSLMNEGMTARIVAAMDAHDAERVAVLRALGVDALPLDAVYREFGGSPEVYRQPGEPMGIRDRIHWRYVDEDVPYGIVLIASVGRLVDVPTPISDAVITLASVVRGVDFWAQGRTAERLGLAGLSAGRLRTYLVEGTMA